MEVILFELDFQYRFCLAILNSSCNYCEGKLFIIIYNSKNFSLTSRTCGKLHKIHRMKRRLSLLNNRRI